MFSNFKSVSKKEWVKKINIDLNGKFDELKSKIEEINIDPIYHADDKIKTFNCNFPSTWENYELIDAKNPEKANKIALNALQNNSNGLCFSQPNNLQILLKNISIEHIRIDFSNYSEDFPKKWENFTKKKMSQDHFTEHQILIFQITTILSFQKERQKNKLLMHFKKD